MSASTRIPAIAQPFVSDRAKRTLDQVGTYLYSLNLLPTTTSPHHPPTPTKQLIK